MADRKLEVKIDEILRLVRKLDRILSPPSDNSIQVDTAKLKISTGFQSPKKGENK